MRSTPTRNRRPRNRIRAYGAPLFVVLLLLLLWVLIPVIVNSVGVEKQAFRELFAAQRSTSLRVILPFATAQAETLQKALLAWNRAGAPCAQPVTNPVGLTFWSSRPVNSTTRALLLSALNRSGAYPCFLEGVSFASAKLSSSEDRYPAGASNQFYSLFLHNPENVLNKSDYLFWMEHDVVPVRKFWVDLLYQQTVRPESFFIKGSIYRGTELDEATKEPAKLKWLPHINGNALYSTKNEFVRLVADAKRRYPPSPSVWFPFDVALWVTMHDFINEWTRFQQIAHKIVYSNFIQNWGNDIDLGYRNLNHPDNAQTIFLHGSISGRQSKVRQLEAQAKRYAEGGNLLQLSFSAKELALVIPLPAAKQYNDLLRSLSLWNEAKGIPCDGANPTSKRVDLIFWIAEPRTNQAAWANVLQLRKWLSSSLSAVLEACFRSVYFRSAKIEPDYDIHHYRDFTGPNLMFYRLFEDRVVLAHDYMFIMEPDVTPIRAGWLNAMYEELLCTSDFWVRGSTYRGYRVDWLYAWEKRFPKFSTWDSPNGNAFYKIHDEDFAALRWKCTETLRMAYDFCLHSHFRRAELYPEMKDHYPKWQLTNFIQNWGSTPFDEEMLVSHHPDTFLVHSSCRKALGANSIQCQACLPELFGQRDQCATEFPPSDMPDFFFEEESSAIAPKLKPF